MGYEEAIKTIRVHHWKWPRSRAIKLGAEFLNRLQSKYPKGIEDTENNTYFVLPGFEHVTKAQPIGVFNYEEQVWELSTTDLFVEPNN